MVVGRKMNYVVTFLLCLVFFEVNAALYDRVNGNELDRRAKHDQCTIETRPCGPHEDRRIDGTCNNYGVPVGGAGGGPFRRMAVPHSKNTDFPSAGSIKKTLLSIRKGGDNQGGYLTSAASGFINFIKNDISALNTSANGKRCCGKDDKEDSRCLPIFESGDDDKTSDKCMEFYRATTFKDLGCAGDYREQINFQTPTLDLSLIYGINDISHKPVRKGEDGLLNEIKNKNGDAGNLNQETGPKRLCIPNKNETACYTFGSPNANNFDLSTTILSIWFIREHNRIASALHRLNPCWKDDRLFKVARSINIATAANIFLYELLPLIMGHRNMFNSGLLSQQIDYVTVYEDAAPLVYAEYEIAMNFFLTLQNGRIKKYDDNNRYIGELPFNETLFNQELLEKGKNYDEISRGLFLQNAAKIDNKLDPEIGEAIYNGNESTPDAFTAGIQRGRDIGVPGYNAYRKICGMTAAKKFDDFLDSMPAEKVEALKKLYKTVDDVEMIPGIFSENPIPNTLIGTTLYCIIAKQLQLFRYSDRFWFERGDQFHSYTLPQLQEIRKSNLAKVACDNSQAIEFIQPHAFRTTGPGNMPLPCSFISGLDLTAWWDANCDRDNPPRKTSFPVPKGNQPTSYMEMLTFFDDRLRNSNISRVFYHNY
ncbi:peroxidase-like [Plodia interpunctella]|uniref:peroxidase-like n=1 Tax=Plodia interpunctella TaxID=58824 RepID=UPI0023685976|nr:peroxidase-like [Plodia interpunctella]